MRPMASGLRVLFFFVLIVIAGTSAFAANTTVAGKVSFSSLDGSTLDADGVRNGIFTVNGDLLIQGSINCNDDGPGNNGACAIRIKVSGNLSMDPGSAIYAENGEGSGAGGDITITTGGNLLLSGAAAGRAGAIISSAGASGGKISVTVGGFTRLEAGTIVSSAASKGLAGAIAITGQGPVEVRGLIAAGPSAARRDEGDGEEESDDHEGDNQEGDNHQGDNQGGDNHQGDNQGDIQNDDGDDLDGGSGKMGGGNITIISSARTQPAVLVTGTGAIVSQGEGSGAGTVSVSGCGIEIRGRVSSLAKDGNGKVTLRSGKYIRIDGRDVGRKAPAQDRLGIVRADSTHETAAGYAVNLIAATTIEVFGPDPALSSKFSVSSSPAANESKNGGGTINAIALGGTLTASGDSFAAGSNRSGNRGGTINLFAAGNVTLDGATVKAVGDYSTSDKTAAGGTINVRSFAGTVSWQVGTGDVRPVGSSSPALAANLGKIIVTSCGAKTLSGTTFVTQGAAVGLFPLLVTSCVPSAPSLPAGELPLTPCSQPPVAVNDAYAVNEGAQLDVAAPGVLANDLHPGSPTLTAILVTAPLYGTLTLNANGSFTYVHDGSETTVDSFQYKANDGTFDSGVATVTITITPVPDPPMATDDRYRLLEGGSIVVGAPGVLANDFDLDNLPLVATLVQGPAHGTLSFHPDGSFVYSHAGLETTSESFTYQVSNGFAVSNVATVFLDITLVDEPPVANNDFYSVKRGGTLVVAAPGVLANDTDEEHDPLTAVLFDPPLHGTLTLNADGSFTYVNDGGAATTDSFTYSAKEPNNFSPIAVVTISITP